jgi:hypothetical protein
MGSLWTGDRSELTKLASHLTTDPVGTEVVLLEVGASSVGAVAVAVASQEGEGTEATGAAVLSLGVGATEAPEITIAAGVRVVVMVTGALVGPTETAMTVMLHTTSKNPSCSRSSFQWLYI